MTSVSSLSFLTPALWIALASFLVVRLDLRTPQALAVALLKAAIPFAYFTWYFDESWTILDDVVYADQAVLLDSLGVSPASALRNPEHAELMRAVTGGDHTLYVWWNLLALRLFGPDYSSAVFLNILLTFVAGFFLARILDHLGFSRSYVRGFLVFFLFHWEIVVWSSLLNVKDTLVLTLTSAALLFLLQCGEKLRPAPLLGLAVTLYLFSTLRFYIPILLLIAFGLWLLLRWQQPRRFLLLIPAAGLIYSILRAWSKAAESVAPGPLVYGLVRFALTPQPWSIDPEARFLLVPSILHWVTFGPALLALAHVWRHSPGARLLILYLALVMLFYASVPELQGPRQRFQVSFVIAWLQYHFLRAVFLSSIARDPLPAGRRPVPS